MAGRHSTPSPGHFGPTEGVPAIPHSPDCYDQPRRSNAGPCEVVCLFGEIGAPPMGRTSPITARRETSRVMTRVFSPQHDCVRSGSACLHSCFSRKAEARATPAARRLRGSHLDPRRRGCARPSPDLVRPETGALAAADRNASRREPQTAIAQTVGRETRFI